MALNQDNSLKSFVNKDQNRVTITERLEELRDSINSIPLVLIRRLLSLKGNFLSKNQSRPNDFLSQTQNSIAIRRGDLPNFEEKILNKLNEFINESLINELTQELNEHFNSSKLVGPEEPGEGGLIFNSIFDALEDWFQDTLDLIPETLEKRIYDKVSTFIELEPSFKRVLDKEFFENELVPLYQETDILDSPEFPEIVRIQKLKDAFLEEIESKLIPDLLKNFNFERVVKSTIRRPIRKVTKSAVSFKYQERLERDVKESKAALLNIQTKRFNIVIRDRILGIFLIVAIIVYFQFLNSKDKIPEDLLKRIEALERENAVLNSRVESFDEQVKKIISEKERLNTELDKVYKELTKVN